MSYQQKVIEELQDLYTSIPVAFVFEGDIFTTLEWSSTKKGKCYDAYPGKTGIPEGYDSIKEGLEYYVGSCGDRVIAVVTDRVAPLYAKHDRTIEEVAENICIVLDVDPDNDSSMDNDDYGMWQ